MSPSVPSRKHIFVEGNGDSCLYIFPGTSVSCLRDKRDELHGQESDDKPLNHNIASEEFDEDFVPEFTPSTRPEPQPEPDNPLASDAVQAWDEFASQVRLVISAKDRAYGGAWRDQGWMGNLARVMSKHSRLRNLLWCDQENEPAFLGAEYVAHAELLNETVHDTIVDLAALAAFLHANLSSDNKWGRNA